MATELHLKTESSSKLVTLFENLLNENKYSEFIDEVKKTPTQELNLEAQDLVPKLCSLLRLKTKKKMFNTCVTTLTYMVSSCDPRILLLILLEEINEKIKLKDVQFLNLLDPIFTCLKRIEFPKSNAMNLAFNELYKRIEYLDLPKDYNLENKERSLLQFDTLIQTILIWLVPLHTHVEELLYCSLNKLPSKSFQTKEIVEFLRFEIKILSRPLAYFDLYHNQESTSVKTKTRSIAESCINNMHSIQPNSIKLLIYFAEQNENFLIKDKGVDLASVTNFPDLGCAVYSYLVFSENLLASNFPSVYIPNYLFQFNLKYVLLLLQKSDSSLLTYKGLRLCTSLFKKLSPGIWPSDYLKNGDIVELMKCAMYIASTTKLSEFCQNSLQIIATVLKAFKLEGRSKVLYFLLSKAPREKVIGFIITLLKDEIVENFDKKEVLGVTLELEKLYHLVFSLPKGEKSDLLEYSGQIMGALNLLRFLVQLDARDKNSTHIWNVLPLVEEKYFGILGSAIALSRSHYKLEIREIMDRRSEKIATGIPLDDENQKLSDVHRIGFLEKAIHTFDMMEEILGKVCSIVKVEKNKEISNSK